MSNRPAVDVFQRVEAQIGVLWRSVLDIDVLLDEKGNAGGSAGTFAKGGWGNYLIQKPARVGLTENATPMDKFTVIKVSNNVNLIR